MLSTISIYNSLKLFFSFFVEYYFSILNNVSSSNPYIEPVICEYLNTIISRENVRK